MILLYLRSIPIIIVKIYAGKIDLSLGISYAFAHRLCYKNSHAGINGIPYSLKFSRVKIFADFKVF